MNVIKKIPPIVWIVLAFWIVATIHVLSSRGLFFDEGIYFIVGKTLVFRNENWNFETWLMGSPWVYPQIVGWILKWTASHGLTGFDWTNKSIPIVREANVLFGVITLLVIYRTSSVLFGKNAAIGAALIFATAGAVIFTSGFATYDTLSLLLTAASIWAAVEGTNEKIPRPLGTIFMIASGAFLGMSFITKYITFVFVPTLLAIIFSRTVGASIKQNLRWLWYSGIFLITAVTVAMQYVLPHFDALKLVFGYSGGHIATYGATQSGILFELIYFGGIAWLLGTIGTFFVLSDNRKWLTALFLILGSLTILFYHLYFHDPLSLFKQVTWSIMISSIIGGVAISEFSKLTRIGAIVVVLGMLIFGIYQVETLEKFYPDPTPAAAWLQTHVKSTDCNILVDDVWAYRWSLNTTFDKSEWCTLDQWWWYNNLTDHQFWVKQINSGVLPYVVFETGSGAFNGNYTVFNQGVVNAVENSGKYVKVAEFPSYVTWGNAIMPPNFPGILAPNSIVTTEIWQRR